MSEPRVPLLDLKAQYASIRPEIEAALRRVVESQRFVMARRIEETVLDFEERLIRAARARGRAQSRELREADVLFEILRRHIRTSGELKLLTVRQYEYAASHLVEIGRLLGGWMKKASVSSGREPVVGTGPYRAGS